MNPEQEEKYSDAQVALTNAQITLAKAKSFMFTAIGAASAAIALAVLL